MHYCLSICYALHNLLQYTENKKERVLLYQRSIIMKTIVSTDSVKRKIYGLILILGALVHLVLLLRDANTYWKAPMSLVDVAMIVGSFAYIIVGSFALRARKPETVLVLRLATIIGLFYGSALGILMATSASGPNEAALGVFLWTILPLHPWLLTHLDAAELPFLLPHLLAFLGMGISGFWIARKTGSVKHGIWSTLLLAMMMTLFILYSGTMYYLIRFVMFSKTTTLFPFSPDYTSGSILFAVSLIPLLVYALISGTTGASLGHSRWMENN